MARIDDYGLREFIGNGTLTNEQQRIRFERTQVALTDWHKETGNPGGSLGEFYGWLGVATAEPEPRIAGGELK